MPVADENANRRKAAREVIDILHEISTLLVRYTPLCFAKFETDALVKNTNLDRQSLSYCVSLIENGVNPEALAKVITELKAQNQRHEAERAAGAQ
ncbi:Mitotic-spindle organizing protein 1 [Teratosphaeria destructans]|uniref:Mitotic-spindle organizing protein 1 n=1 Tax=Teratosphaeria destructans TaxID=418781 RepID=A0A9W7T029_9PEZI|nr:Mitotic-spindle organizing protein 1 [Teratosphaeria destructans]